MKEKITFPDWTRLAGQIITRNGENGKRPIWRAYDQDPAGDFLALRVTLEIAGANPVFLAENPLRLIAGRGRFVTDDGAVIVGRRARPEEESRELPVAFVPHWKTCPNAGDFRRHGRG